MSRRLEVPIDKLDVAVYRIPTDQPESDGTYAWDHTALVLAEISAGGKRGLGYSYADEATGHLIKGSFSRVVEGANALNVPKIWQALVYQIRNLGRPGIAAMAISAVDTCLWDLKAKLLDVPLCTLLGMAHERVPVYGSGGFTSYSISKLQEQLGGWAKQGIPRVKMKIGTRPEDDLNRVRAARKAIGDRAELFVDANGAYSRKQALAFAQAFTELNVSWFEEPVSSDDLAGLHLIRNRAPAGMEIAAGEYGYDLWYFRRMLEAEAVDVLQADVTRCGGFTGFIQAAGLCQARSMQISGHCAPSLHLHVCLATVPLRHLEYFHDHERIEHLLFDGAPTPIEGALHPDLTRPGLGLEFKHADAKRFLVWQS
ncbi:MAG TPA: enolase C-terminal domain-like protein [Gemmataceae bacterium]|nr:enolase C-terminal domain-like protein [Gemmataceae bacterium]